MIEFKKGDILTSNADIICHQVNCKGVMGRGLAKQIRDKYPNVYEAYKEFINIRKKVQLPILGQVYLATIDKGRWIANCFAQDGYGTTKSWSDIEALENCLKQIRNFARSRDECGHPTTIAIPYDIGCGLGGGDKDRVHTLLTTLFWNESYLVELWIYE